MSARRDAASSGDGRVRRDPPPAGAATRRSDRLDRRDRVADAPARRRRSPRDKEEPETRPKRPIRTGPPTTGIRRPGPPTSTKQAKARSKARKAKAPKVVRPPLRERLIARLTSIDLRPKTLAAKVPFVVLVIGSLGIGLAATLWLSTYSAERSYELGNAREKNRVLAQKKDALEREVLEAQSAPALAEAARNLGMIPSRDTAHLVQDPAGNWVVVGEPKPAEGTSPPPLNAPLPDPVPPPPPVDPREVVVRVPGPSAPATPLAAPGPEAVVQMPVPQAHAPAAGALPDPAALPGPAAHPDAAAAPAPAALPEPAPPPAAPPPPEAPAPPAVPAPAALPEPAPPAVEAAPAAAPAPPVAPAPAAAPAPPPPPAAPAVRPPPEVMHLQPQLPPIQVPAA